MVFEIQFTNYFSYLQKVGVPIVIVCFDIHKNFSDYLSNFEFL